MNKKQLQKQIVELYSLNNLTDAYAKIASSRMKKTRDETLTSRSFTKDVSDVFEEVRKSYAKEIMSLKKKKRRKKGQDLTFLSHNGKTVSVFISSNTGLYGEIVQKTFELFLDGIEEDSSEVTIVGKYGRALYLEARPGKPYTFFDISDKELDKGDLLNLLRHVVQYEKIKVYYGKFESVVSQVPEELVISAKLPEVNESEVEEKKTYIFEPTLEGILIFFEKEIFASDFEQTMRESSLAKFASRMLAMDTAGQRVRERINELSIRKLKATHNERNKKQLNSMTAKFALAI